MKKIIKSNRSVESSTDLSSKDRRTIKRIYDDMSRLLDDIESLSDEGFVEFEATVGPDFYNQLLDDIQDIMILKGEE